MATVRPAIFLLRRGVPRRLRRLVAPAATTTTPTPVDVGQAGARTTAAGTARFTLAIGGTVSGLAMRADERGSVAFNQPRAHIYKLLATGGIPQEQIVDGPFVYTNGNVQAAMADTRIKAWTKLDTRRLTAASAARTAMSSRTSARRRT